MCCGLGVWAFVTCVECGRDVSGSVIILGALLGLSACLGDAPGVRWGPLPFLSIFPFVAFPF